jgi:hypothetical protein
LAKCSQTFLQVERQRRMGKVIGTINRLPA